LIGYPDERAIVAVRYISTGGEMQLAKGQERTWERDTQSISGDQRAIQSPSSITESQLLTYSILLAIYASSIAMAGPHGAKLVELGPFTFDAGLLTYSLCFLVTDVVSEVYGKEFSKKIIAASFFGLIGVFFTTRLALLVPASPLWQSAEGFDAVFGIGSRVFLASITAFLFSQIVDIYTFSWVKRRTGHRFLWIRNNFSTMIGGGVDVVIFSSIAFYGIYPLGPIMVSAYVIRILVSVIDTPLVYLGVYLLRGQEKKASGLERRGPLSLVQG
jgi:uncharacterized integral membrane protein (TIGR00697 family)